MPTIIDLFWSCVESLLFVYGWGQVHAMVGHRVIKVEPETNHICLSGSRKFCQRGSNFDNFSFFTLFFVDEGRDDPNTTKIGPSSASQ